MTDTQLHSARIKLARELEQLPAYLYTPMTKEEWERNEEIVEKVLGEAFGEDEKE